MNNPVKHDVWDPTGAPMTVDNSDMHVVQLMRPNHISSINTFARVTSHQTAILCTEVAVRAINKMMEKTS